MEVVSHGPYYIIIRDSLFLLIHFSFLLTAHNSHVIAHHSSLTYKICGSHNNMSLAKFYNCFFTINNDKFQSTWLVKSVTEFLLL